MILFFLLLVIGIIIIQKLNLIKNKYLKTITKYFLIALVTSMALELTVFNFRHYESLVINDEYKELKDYSLTGIVCNNECQVVADEAYIEIKNLDSELNTLYLDLANNGNLFMKYELSFTDDANQLYLVAGEREYADAIVNSHYAKVNPSGHVHDIKIKILEIKDKKSFQINQIAINPHVPLFINDLRLVLCLILVFGILCVNPKNNLFELDYNFKKAKVITGIVIILISGVFGSLTLLNSKSYTTRSISHYSQYKNLAKALAKGQFYLDLEVSPKLEELENPYDTKYRDSKVERYEEYFWDYAYYNGKYYTYFGVVPCMLLYLPYYLITNNDLPNYLAMGIAIFFLTMSIFYLLYQIVKKYFPKTSYMWYLILGIFFVMVSGVPFFSGEPTFYNLPVSIGMALSCFGLGFWLKATMSEKLKTKYLCLGSTFMALVAGCRPQLLMGSFLAIIIFSDYIIKKRELFSKKSWKETLLFIIPYVVIAGLLMYYNYARFGSVFDFGANYNLTTNDMTKRGLKFDRIFLGLYYFLFAPSKVSTLFPFIENYRLTTSYLGKTIYENMYGGFYFRNLICVLGLLFYKFKKIINNKTLSNICLATLLFAVVIILADTQMAGILPRYIYDFSWLLCIGTIIVILSLIKNEHFHMEFKKLIITFILISVIYNVFTYFMGYNLLAEMDSLRKIYYYLYYTFNFWL